MKALNAGKHVLLEKPSSNSADETSQMFELAESKGLVLLEAFHYRYFILATWILYHSEYWMQVPSCRPAYEGDFGKQRIGCHNKCLGFDSPPQWILRGWRYKMEL
jgi:hypothetical protein